MVSRSANSPTPITIKEQRHAAQNLNNGAEETITQSTPSDSRMVFEQLVESSSNSRETDSSMGRPSKLNQRGRLMKLFADSIISVAPVATRKSRNRFFRGYDRWTNRLFKLGLISLSQRQELRKQIAGAYIASLI